MTVPPGIDVDADVQFKARFSICMDSRWEAFSATKLQMSAGGMKKYDKPIQRGLLSCQRRMATSCWPLLKERCGRQVPGTLSFESSFADFEAALRENHAVQQGCGASWIRLMDPKELRTRLAWRDIAQLLL